MTICIQKWWHCCVLMKVLSFTSCRLGVGRDGVCGRGEQGWSSWSLCHCFSRCPISKVSASSRYLLPPLPSGPPPAAAARSRLPPGPPGAVAAGPQRPHGPGPPAQRRPASVADPAAHPAVPGRHRSLLPTSGPAPAIPPAAAAPGSSAPQAPLAPQVCVLPGQGLGGAGRGQGPALDPWLLPCQAWPAVSHQMSLCIGGSFCSTLRHLFRAVSAALTWYGFPLLLVCVPVISSR